MVEVFISLLPTVFLTLPTVTTVRVLYSLKVLSVLTQMMTKAETINFKSNRSLFEGLLRKTETYLSHIHNKYGHRTARMALHGLQFIGRAAKDASRSSAETAGSHRAFRTDDEATHNNDLDIVTSLNMVDIDLVSLQSIPFNPLESSNSFQELEASPWPLSNFSDFELITMPDLDPQSWLYPSQATHTWEGSDDLVDPSAATAISAGVVVRET